jgi:hypothetical protein
MIKLANILKEMEMTNDKHWRDHFKEIITCAETALSSNDPETIAKQCHDIIEHADVASSKHQATYEKAPTPTFTNSNIGNSYAGDDSDIHAYQDQRI